MANRNLNLLLTGRFVSDIGTRMQYTILPLYILDLGGSPTAMGTFSLLTMLPMFLLLPFGGVVGDRLNRKKIMVNCDIIAGSLILGLGMLAFLELVNLVILIAVQVAVGIVSVFFEASSGGMIPSLVEKDDLAAANSKVGTLRTLAGIFGPLAGAALYSFMGIVVVFMINGLSFLLSAFSEMFIHYVHNRKEIKTGITGIIFDIKEGAVFIKDNKLIRRTCLYFFAIMTLLGPVFVLLIPIMFKTNLNYSDTWYGALQTIQVTGSLLGVISVGILSKRLTTEESFRIGNKLLIVLVTAFTIVLFPFIYNFLGNSSISYFILLAFTLMLISFAFSFLGIPVQTLIQKTTPPEYMSRVYSIVGLISKGGIPIGAFLFGILMSNMSVHFVMTGVVLFLLPVIVIFNYKLKKI